MGNLYSYLITNNEAGRYLARTILNLMDYVDGFLVYDDRSEDTAYFPVLKDLCGGEYATRPEHVPSFLENESQFRQAAWQKMEETFHPKEGDWIISLDADEELIPADRAQIDQVTASTDATGIWLPVREIWEQHGTDLYARTDGYWGTITALRLVAYKQPPEFVNKGMGGGSVPSYVTTTIMSHDLQILHYGYTEQADREIRYERYSQNLSHNPTHIKSILQPATLEKVDV